MLADASQNASDNVLDTHSGLGAAHALQCSTLEVGSPRTAALCPVAECTIDCDAALSDDAFQESPGMPAIVRPIPAEGTNTLLPAATWQQRPAGRPASPNNHSTSHVPLAQRMREVSNKSYHENYCANAANVCRAASSAASLPPPPRPLQPAAGFSNERPKVAGTAHMHRAVPKKASSRGMHPAAVLQNHASLACPAYQVHALQPAELGGTAGLIAEVSKPAHYSAAPFLSDTNPVRVRQGGDTVAIRTERPTPIPAALLQRWLAYRPPPGHFSGLQQSQCVPGCKFLVDSFSKVAQKSGTRAFFLTHFHYDHYRGLSKRFSSGTLYCTPETARLVQLKLKV